MDDSRPIPWPGMLLAAATGVGMLIAGAGLLLIAVVLLVWLGSLWISRPAPQQVQIQTDSVQLTREGMGDLIEQFSLPVLLLDRNRIIIANSAARVVFGKHIVGQDARVGLRHPQAVKLLDRKKGGSVTVQGLTTPNSIWRITRHAINDRYWVIELHNRTAEADISKAHTDFVANASHELRTPLASIIGYVETLAEDGNSDPETTKRFLETVLREARRLQSLVSDLMSLSRIEAEKHDQPSEEIDFSKLVMKAAKEAGPSRDRDRVKITVPKGEIKVRGEAQQLEQLVRNLVDNALKYGDPETDVDVVIEQDGDDRVVLSIVDRGEGIPPEHIPHLTRRFYRTDPGRSRAGGGTGLGLAIVKHIVERHRGRLDISSKQGEGTIVSVRLPLIG
ncbi:MAG TPA: ATP-binding protein [Sphingomonadaceae bacterium]|nr:ATP-binding protein [Sphingomonadaceae bacterium]